MPSLSPKDRVSLCRFTFTDGRCCRTPRTSSHPHFCYDHAQKEARACAAETLGKDLAFFFSGDYLSANDLSTALARLIPAVVQGHVKPRPASTLAYPPPPHLTPHKHPPPTPLRQPLNPTIRHLLPNPLRHARLPQTPIPTRCTSITTTASANRRNPFRINTYKPTSQLLILNHLRLPLNPL